MVITMTTMDKKGKYIKLHTDDLRVQDDVASPKDLFLTMQVMARNVRHLGETAEFVISDESLERLVRVRRW